MSDQRIISDIERKRLSTVGSEQSTNPDSNHRSIERGTQPRLLSGVIRSLKYWGPIPADFARARDTQTTTLDTTEARERRLIERGIAIVVAAIVLIFWGATLTWPAMLLVTAIIFQDSLRSLLTGLTIFVSKTAIFEVNLGKNRWFKLSAPETSEILQKVADEVKTAVSHLTPDQEELFLYLAQDRDVLGKTLGEGLQFHRERPRSCIGICGSFAV